MSHPPLATPTDDSADSLQPRHLGFMVAAAFLSMWVSNTATTVMMMPIGLAIIKACAEITGEKAARTKARSISLQTWIKPFWMTRYDNQ